MCAKRQCESHLRKFFRKTNFSNSPKFSQKRLWGVSGGCITSPPKIAHENGVGCMKSL
jgi:hypothetical protein